MFIPFDMIAVMLFVGYYAGTPGDNPPSLAASLLVVFAGTAAFAAGAALLNFLTLRRLRRGLATAKRRNVAARTDFLLRAAMVAFYIALLTESALPWSVVNAFGWKAGEESLVVQLVALIPYLLLFIAGWLPMYRLHRETNFGAWTRRSFLIHKARYNLFMLLAWLPFAVLADWLSDALLALPFLFILAAWTFPWLLAKAWGCKPLTDEKTLDMVRRLEERAKARFSRVFLWEPGGGVQNAAAVGIFRPFRYLFLTPALIANMKPPELEAVILHELGHVRKRHLLFYLFTSLAGVNLAVFLGAVVPMTGNTEKFVLTVLLVLAYFRLAFGWLSRTMERQADLFSLEKTGSDIALANALEKLGIAAGNIRRAASWHHLGIAERVGFLHHAQRHPALAARHNARTTFIMVVGYTVSILVIAGMGWLLRAELAPPTPRLTAVPGDGVEAHWRRVMQIMPGNATAPLELAYHLAADPNARGEAAVMAEKAQELACGSEERAAAAKLADELAEARQ